MGLGESRVTSVFLTGIKLGGKWTLHSAVASVSSGVVRLPGHLCTHHALP